MSCPSSRPPKVYNPALTRSEDSNWREMPVSKQTITENHQCFNPLLQNKKYIQGFHDISCLQVKNVTHLSFKCSVHTVPLVSIVKPLPEALSRSCTLSTWQINESTTNLVSVCIAGLWSLLGNERLCQQSVPRKLTMTAMIYHVVIPPWTRLQIQISDPLDVLRWSHHLPLGIANQLHHILSCGGLPMSTIVVKTALLP